MSRNVVLARLALAVALAMAAASQTGLAAPSAPAAPPPVAHLSTPADVAAPPTATMEVTMDAATPDATADPALQAWREEVLPELRALLAAEKTELEALAASGLEATDPEVQRTATLRLEARKLDGERRLVARQLEWARTWSRQDLTGRLQARLSALDSALSANGTGAGPAESAPSAPPADASGEGGQR